MAHSNDRAASETLSPMFLLLSAGLLVSALLLGGATREGQLLNAVVRLISLPVAMLAIWRLSLAPWSKALAAPVALLAAAAAIPLIQLVPLPPALWQVLPGRDEFAEVYRLGLMPAPWLPLSLNPDGTWNAALALLPAIAMFLACLTLGPKARLGLVLAVSGVAIVALLLGTAQVLDGRDSTLRFYEVTNASAAVGFFSNRNHQATLQLAAMPLVTYALMVWSTRSGARPIPVFLLGGALFLLLAVGTALSESRAGVLLAPPVGLACLLMVLHRTPMGLSRRTLMISLAAILIFALGAGALVLKLMPDIATSIMTDVRAKALPIVAAETIRHLPFGSGLGTFDDIYRTQESPETLSNAFLNHAHDDYMELFLETGLFGIVLVILFLFWFGQRVIQLWRSHGEDQDLARAGTIVVGLILAHSLVDYPLRTAAMSAVFALACGLLLTPVGQPEVARLLPGRTRDTALPRRVRQLPARR